MRLIVTRALLVLLLFPVGASAQTSVWSATMTVGIHDTPEATFVGYHPAVEIGSIDHLEFAFVGKTYTINTLVQALSGSQVPADDVGSITLRFNPGVLPHSDLETMNLLVDGEQLEVAHHSYSGSEDNPRGAVIRFVDPGWRWEEGQEVSLELTTTLEPVPALPVVGSLILALILLEALHLRRQHAYRVLMPSS